MASIGGYLGLELREQPAYHEDLLPLNTGRNALEYLLRIKEYQAIYLPYYACDVLLEPIKKLGIKHIFYRIDEQLQPIIDAEIPDDACLLYINYYGLMNETVAKLCRQVKNIIIDNSQAFFARPVAGIDTFYSCRKFFGVPDGAYLATNSERSPNLPADTSYERCNHLLRSRDEGTERGYADFIANEHTLQGQPIKQMSPLTQALMASVDYDYSRTRRNSNFKYLHRRLSGINEVNLNFSAADGPLVYPLLVSKPGVKEQLIKLKIFVATYWPNVAAWAGAGSWEAKLASQLVALPVDQRYDETDMERIAETLIKLVQP